MDGMARMDQQFHWTGLASEYEQSWPGYVGYNNTEVLTVRTEGKLCDDWQRIFEGCLDVPYT